MSRARRELGAVADAESLFRTYFERLPEPAFVAQRAAGGWRVLMHNRAARAGGREVGGGGVDEVLPGGAELVEQLEACVGDGGVREHEAERPGVDGETRRIAMTFVPVGDAAAVVRQRDVTEEHRAREALAESERHVRTLIRSNPELLIRMTGDGCYLEFHAPPEVRASLLFDPDECVGRYVEDLHEPEFAALHAYYRRKVLEDGSVQFWQYTRRTRDGLANLEARFVRSGDDEVLITVRDVGRHVEREREVVLSVERERNRIGRDLHDGLAQLLTGANLLLEPIREPLGRERPEHGDNLGQAVDLIRQAIAQTRELARGLSPVPRGDGFSLSDALAELGKQSQDYFGLSCRCDCRGALPDLSAETAANLYRIAQEAITNAVKHGGAQHVDLACRVVDGRLELAIRDDGCGIGLDESLAGHSGMGLDIMRYRARAIGAELGIGPGEDGGTIVQCTIAGPRGRNRAADAEGPPGC